MGYSIFKLLGCPEITDLYAMSWLFTCFFSLCPNGGSAAERARVRLAPLAGAKGSDYINASYVMVTLSITDASLVHSKCPQLLRWCSTVVLTSCRVTTAVRSSSLPSILCPTPLKTSGEWSGTITPRLSSCCRPPGCRPPPDWCNTQLPSARSNMCWCWCDEGLRSSTGRGWVCVLA